MALRNWFGGSASSEDPNNTMTSQMSSTQFSIVPHHPNAGSDSLQNSANMLAIAPPQFIHHQPPSSSSAFDMSMSPAIANAGRESLALTRSPSVPRFPASTMVVQQATTYRMENLPAVPDTPEKAQLRAEAAGYKRAVE